MKIAFKKFNNSLIITPNSLKEFFLNVKKNNPYLNAKIINKEELIENLDFRVLNDADIFLATKLHISIELAKNYLDNIHISKDNDISDKITQIKNVRKILKEANYLIFNHLFKHELASRKIIVFGYSNLDYELFNWLKPFNYEIIENEKNCYSISPVHYFDNSFSELSFVCDEISRLINQGIDIRKIHIVNSIDGDSFYLKRFARMYNLPINISDGISLTTTPIFTDFMKQVSVCSVEEAVKELKTRTFDDENAQIIQKALLKVISQVFHFTNNKEDFINILRSKCKDVKTCLESFEHGINVTNNFELPEDDYIFVLNFNQSKCPSISTNTDFLTDKEKELCGFLTSKIKNKIEKEKWIIFLKTHVNLFITFKEIGGQNVFYLSSLANDLGMNIITNDSSKNVFSKKVADLKLAIMEDKYRKYLQKDEQYDLFNNSLVIPYLAFDYKYHQFKPIGENRQLRFSYSSLKNYFMCPYSYYLNTILGVNEFEDNFATLFGSLMHTILQKSYDQDFVFDDVYKKVLLKLNFDSKGKLLCEKYKSNIEEFVKYNVSHESSIKGREYMLEHKLSTRVSESSILEGTFDKIVISKDIDNHKYASIVDYKTTSKQDIRLNYLQYGFSLQLPIYAYLYNKSFGKNGKLIGMYIQHFNPFDYGQKSFMDNEDFQLKGLSIDEINQLQTFDADFGINKDEQYVGSSNLKGDGTFSARSKTFSQSVLNNMNDTVKQLLVEAETGIREGNFKINPKKTSFEDACLYCSFKDICFRKEDSYTVIRLNEEGDDSDGSLDN